MLRPVAIAVALVMLGVAAAQPASTHASRLRVRTGVEALFVFDTSRSMAASASPRSPTRLARAVATAERLRATIGDVPTGIATLTDRVLPDLLPVAGTESFDAVAAHAVAIESPPPQASAVRATSFAALADIAAGNYFEPTAKRRLVVLLTDGESSPTDAGRLATALAGARLPIPGDPPLARRRRGLRRRRQGRSGLPARPARARRPRRRRRCDRRPRLRGGRRRRRGHVPAARGRQRPGECRPQRGGDRAAAGAVPRRGGSSGPGSVFRPPSGSSNPDPVTRSRP
jgi:hypothetical protein